MHLDVLRGIDALVQSGQVDPDRLAVMGWSAGAHLVNKLITTTTRFKAASAMAGAANFVSFFAQTDMRAHRAVWFGGMPWTPDAPVDAFWNNSPSLSATSDVCSAGLTTMTLPAASAGAILYSGIVRG